MVQARRTSAAIEVRLVTRLLRALGDETRLRIVALLAHGELCVCHIERALELPQSTTSRQLAVLRASGVVETRRQGTWVHYRLAKQTDELCRRLLGALTRAFAARETLRHDVERLLAVQGPGRCA